MYSIEKVIPVEIIGEIKDSPNVQLRSHGKPPIVDSVKRRSRTDVSPSESKRTSLLITHDDGTTEWQNTEALVVTSNPTKVEDLKIEEIGRDTLSRITRSQIDTPAISKVRVKESSISREVLSPEVITIDVGDMNSPFFLRDTDPLSPRLEIYSIPNSPSPPPICVETEVESDYKHSDSTATDPRSNKCENVHLFPTKSPPSPEDKDKNIFRTSATHTILDHYVCPKTPETTPIPSPGPKREKLKDLYSFDSENCYINSSSKESSLANYPIPSPLPPPSRSISEISWIPDLESPSLLQQNICIGQKQPRQTFDLKEVFNDNEIRGQTNGSMPEDMISYIDPNNPPHNLNDRENHCQSSKNEYKDNNLNLMGNDALQNSLDNHINDHNKTYSIIEQHKPVSDSTAKSNKLLGDKVVRIPIEVKIINSHTPSTFSSINQSGTKRDSYNDNQNKQNIDLSKQFQHEGNPRQDVPVRIIPISLSDGKMLKQNETLKYDDFVGSELTGEKFNKSWSNMRETNIIGCEDSQNSGKQFHTSKIQNDQDKVIPIIIDRRKKSDSTRHYDRKSESDSRRRSNTQAEDKPSDISNPYRKQSLDHLLDKQEQGNKVSTVNQLSDSTIIENIGEQRKSRYRKISNTEEISTKESEIHINRIKPLETENTANIFKHIQKERHSSNEETQLEKSDLSMETKNQSNRVINIPIQIEGKLKPSKPNTLKRSQTVEESSEPFEYIKPQNLKHVHDELVKAQGKLAAQVLDLKTEIGQQSKNIQSKPAKLMASLRSRSVESDQGNRHNNNSEETSRPKSTLNHERSLQDINKDIETIWKELKALEKLPVTANMNAEETGDKADDPIPGLPTWETERQSRNSERAKNRKDEQTKHQRRQSSSESRTIWDSPSCFTEPSKTSSVPIHFSFLPKQTETKPGSITSPSDLKGKVSSSPIRTIPINKQSSPSSKIEKQPSKQSPNPTIPAKKQSTQPGQKEKLPGKQSPDIPRSGKTSKKKESSKEREATVSTSPVFKRRSSELAQNSLDTTSELGRESNSPISQGWKSDATCQSSSTTSTMTSSSLKSCLKSESRISDQARNKQLDSMIDQSPLSVKSTGVNFMTEPTIKTFNNISNTQYSGQDQAFQWLKDEREEGKKEETTSSTHHTTSWSDVNYKSSKESNYKREVPIQLTNQSHDENEFPDNLTPEVILDKEESPISFDELSDKSIIEINPTDYYPCDVSTQTEISVKHKNCCLM